MTTRSVARATHQCRPRPKTTSPFEEVDACDKPEQRHGVQWWRGDWLASFVLRFDGKAKAVSLTKGAQADTTGEIEITTLSTPRYKLNRELTEALSRFDGKGTGGRCGAIRLARDRPFIFPGGLRNSGPFFRRSSSSDGRFRLARST